MKKIIYLAGGMTGLSLEEQNSWRVELKSNFEELTSNVSVINPLDHFSFFSEDYKNDKIDEKEILRLDLDKVRKSDLIIVNFNEPKSIGTACELCLANEHRIPIIGLNENNNEIHPWLEYFSWKIFADKNDLYQYVCEHFLNN